MKYKHKKLLWIAELIDGGWYYHDGINKDLKETIDGRLLEGDDWQLIEEEKDWIDEVFKYTPTDDMDLQEFRELIEEHLPKITEEEINLIVKANREDNYITEIIKLLKSKGLYKD